MINFSFTQIQESADFLQQIFEQKGLKSPEIGIILGTGLGNLVNQISILAEIPYKEIPHFPVSTVETHAGKLIYGTLSGKTVLAMQGRFHYYEGYSMAQITLPVRVMKLLGVQKLLISNASGALNATMRKGELMLINDHIDLMPENPLRGKNLAEFGDRFPDMSAPYNAEINQKIINIALKNSFPLHVGVYAALQGPNLETRAEYRYLQRIGADAVGMSTVPEVLVANHCRLPCVAVSVLTDECNPDNLQPTTLEDIIKAANDAEKMLTHIFIELLKEI
jgi:purine-nucleoside phosphorylase